MPKRHTIDDVALRAGVSRSTVSLVLRNSPLVREAKRQRIMRAIEELGYVYNRGAARLRDRITQTAALLVCELTHVFYAEMTAGIDAALDAAGWVCFMANTAEGTARQSRFLERMREQGVDGVILCPAAGTSPELIHLLRTWRMACVQAVRCVATEDADFVGSDNRLGAMMATRHLIELGWRNVSFVGGAPVTSVSRDRIAGYRDAMKAYGLTGNIIDCRRDFDEAAEIGAAFARTCPREAAAVCFNDRTAFGFMSGLRDAGKEPGLDVGVVGFDGSAESAQCRPGLTSVSTQPRGTGEAAAALLLRRIRQPEAPPERVILPPQLLVRGSCGALQGGAAPGRASGSVMRPSSCEGGRVSTRAASRKS